MGGEVAETATQDGEGRDQVYRAARQDVEPASGFPLNWACGGYESAAGSSALRVDPALIPISDLHLYTRHVRHPIVNVTIIVLNALVFLYREVYLHVMRDSKLALKSPADRMAEMLKKKLPTEG